MNSRIATTLGCVFLLTATLPAPAAEVLPGPIPAHAEAVIDGDTIEVTARIWPGVSTRARIRLASIDTPELASPCPAARAKAAEAKALVRALVSEAGTMLNLVRIRPEMAYGRILADIQLADGTDLGEALMSAGLAKPYGNRVRCDWCQKAPRCGLAMR